MCNCSSSGGIPGGFGFNKPTWTVQPSCILCKSRWACAQKSIHVVTPSEWNNFCYNFVENRRYIFLVLFSLPENGLPDFNPNRQSGASFSYLHWFHMLLVQLFYTMDLTLWQNIHMLFNFRLFTFYRQSKFAHSFRASIFATVIVHWPWASKWKWCSLVSDPNLDWDTNGFFFISWPAEF